MVHYIAKYNLRNADDDAYSLLDLKDLIDDLKIQIKIISHKLSKVVIAYPLHYSPDRLVYFVVFYYNHDF